MKEFRGQKLLEIDRIATGKNIRRVVHGHNLRVGDIAEALGVSYKSVYKWYRGDNFPDLERLYCLAQILSTTIDELIVEKKV